MIAMIQLIGESTKRRTIRRVESVFVAMVQCNDRC